MADGDIVFSTQGSRVVKLSDAAAGVTTGQWVECGEYDTGMVVVDYAPGTFVGTYNVVGSNATTIPSNSANGVPLATALTASGSVTIATCPRWIKGYVSPFTSGSISVNAVLRNFGA